MTLCQGLLCLSIACLIAGYLAAMQGRNPGSKVEMRFWGPRLEMLMLIASSVGSCSAYTMRLFSNCMIVLGLWYCGHYELMAVAIIILVGAQIFAAYEYAADEEELVGKVKKVLLSLLQLRVFIDAYRSWQQKEVVPSLVRQKFVDAVVDTGTFSIFAVYVMFYFEINDDVWLTLSVWSAILTLAFFMTDWMSYTFKKQLAEDEVPPDVYSIQMHHHILWFSYLSVDFSLRLVTLGLFLACEFMRPWNQLIFGILVLAYFVAVALPIKNFESEQGRTFDIWNVDGEHTVTVRRTIVANSAVGALVFTFLVNAMPADLRLAPRSSQESHLLFALDPKVREKILVRIIPLRSTEYVLLSVASMYTNFDPWRCAALVTMWITMHLLLAEVLQLRLPRGAARKPTDMVPETIRTTMTDADHRPVLAHSVMFDK